MFILKLGQIVDILIDDDPQVVALVMRCDVALGECFRHDWESLIERDRVLRSVQRNNMRPSETRSQWRYCSSAARWFLFQAESGLHMSLDSSSVLSWSGDPVY